MEAIVRARGEGTRYARPGVTVKVASGAATVFETARAAGDSGGPGPHSHPGFDETFYVLSGEWEFTIGDQELTAAEGTVVHLPRGIFHTFCSTGRVDGRLLGVAVPGGIEEFFSEASTADDSEAIRTVASTSDRSELNA